ncbi:MAG: hypothetical protein HPY64_16760 [Anaerolineae bacterium]|nr:hypothetical protein [Anaerolineae bacterium]
MVLPEQQNSHPPSRRFWMVVALLLGFMLILRLLTYGFSLPYVDHPDEPNYYLAAQEVRGLFDNQGYYDHAPPAYIYLATVVQVLTEPLGAQGMAAQVRLLRLLAVLLNLGTLVFIALAARRAGGERAGIVAGLLWAVSPLVLINGVYALPDPPIYFLASLAIWLAGEALAVPRRGSWSVWAIGIGTLAVAFKAYLPLFVPGALATLLITAREWRQGGRRGLRYLAWQIGIVVLTMLWVVFGIGFVPTAAIGPADGGADTLLHTIREGAAARLLDPTVFLNNLRFALEPLDVMGTLAMLGLGVTAVVVARLVQRRASAVRLNSALMIAVYVVVVAWIVSAYTRVDRSTIRYMIPATVGLCVLVGMAFAQVVALAPTPRQPAASAILLLGLGGLVLLPQLRQDLAIVQDRSRTDQRADLRFWAEITLETGPVLVTQANEKTFNNIWSGMPVSRWFDWLVADNIAAYPVEHWREERGMRYVLLTDDDRTSLQEAETGRAFLDDLLLLREFPERPDRRGPGLIMYRLWPMQTPLDVRFGPTIHLVGYDLESADLTAGGVLTLRLYWQADAAPVGDYSLFVHLTPLDERNPVAQWDGPPARLERPTPSWNAPSETLVSQPIALSLPPDLPAGQYRVLVGLYDYVSRVRLPVTISEGDVQALADDSLQLLMVTIE